LTLAKNLNYLNKLSTQASKYGLVGIIGNLIGYCTYILFTFLGLTPVLAITLLYPVGAIFGYYGNKEYTFSYKGKVSSSSIRYIIAHFGGYLMNISLLHIFVSQFNLPHQLVQAAAIFIVAIYLFFTLKMFVFSNK